MGFFSLKAICGVCGKEAGWNRYKIALDNAWCCSECLKKANKAAGRTILVSQATISGLKKLVNGGIEAYQENKECRKKCNVCGHIFCYSDIDIYRNKQLAREAKSSANLAVLEALGGTHVASNQQSAAADRAIERIVDYSKCPKCNSTNLSDVTEEEIRQAGNGNNNSTVSAADELKKYKELLDSGVISREEFDAKKKQLLGL